MIRIASGGELSRIMLALRSVLNEKYGVGVSIYDEIDTGISGRTARKVGIKLRRIARCGQVICVTHSAQIASLADAQYRIEKARGRRQGRDLGALSGAGGARGRDSAHSGRSDRPIPSARCCPRADRRGECL